MTLWGPLHAWATYRTARMDIRHLCPSMLLVRFLAPNEVHSLIWGLFPADKRLGWGAAMQPEQTGGRHVMLACRTDLWSAQLLSVPLLYIDGPSAFRGSLEYTQ